MCTTCSLITEAFRQAEKEQEEADATGTLEGSQSSIFSGIPPELADMGIKSDMEMAAGVLCIMPSIIHDI